MHLLTAALLGKPAISAEVVEVPAQLTKQQFIHPEFVALMRQSDEDLRHSAFIHLMSKDL